MKLTQNNIKSFFKFIDNRRDVRKPFKVVRFTEKIPEESVHQGSFSVGMLDDSSTLTLPDPLYVKGSFSFFNEDYSKLPSTLYVEDNCTILFQENFDNKYFPKSLHVQNIANFYFGKLVSLPLTLTVDYMLEITGVFPILPENFNVKVLSLKHIRIPEGHPGLSKGLQVGSLRAGGTEVQSLPDNLVVTNNVFLSKSNLERIGSGVKIGGVLDIIDTKIDETNFKEAVSPDLQVDGYILMNTNRKLTKKDKIELSKHMKYIKPSQIKDYVKM